MANAICMNLTVTETLMAFTPSSTLRLRDRCELRIQLLSQELSQPCSGTVALDSATDHQNTYWEVA